MSTLDGDAEAALRHLISARISGPVAHLLRDEASGTRRTDEEIKAAALAALDEDVEHALDLVVRACDADLEEAAEDAPRRALIASLVRQIERAYVDAGKVAHKLHPDELNAKLAKLDQPRLSMAEWGALRLSPGPFANPDDLWF